MSCGIYKIEYKGDIAYVGSSINIEKRWKQHILALKNNSHRNFLLQRCYNKNGFEHFNFSIIKECAVNDLTKEEQYYIDTLKPMFNLSDANGRHLHTEETKAKMRGRIVSEETRKKLSKALKGRISPKKGKKTGIVPKTAFKKGLVPWNKGKKLKPSWNKGKHLSETHKNNLRISHLNKEPTKAQIIYWESLRGKPRLNRSSNVKYN